MVDVEPDGLSDETVTYPPRVVIYGAAEAAPEPTAVPSDRAGQLRAAIGDAGAIWPPLPPPRGNASARGLTGAPVTGGHPHTR